MIKVLAVLISMAISLLFISCTDNQPASDQSATALPSPVIQENPAARITVTEASALVKSGTGVLVDTRSAEQFAVHRATGAISAPIQKISDKAKIPALEAIPLDQKLILYCT